jgi:hypothetical protein
VTAEGAVRIGTLSTDTIREYGSSAGVVQGDAIPDATNEATAISGLNSLLAYFRARGTIAT